ncbi:MAG: hypothetical protein WAK82_13155, partial [Streptosporangiaceae bacterium]
MHNWVVARGQHRHGGPRRDDGHRLAGGPGRAPFGVAGRRPGQQFAAPDQPRTPGLLDHGAVRQLRHRRLVGPPPRTGQPVGVPQ